MDNHRVGSLNSLADYGRGESDIEDSDDEIDTEEGRFQPRSSFSVYTQSRVKLSARLVSYDDVAEEEDVEQISDKKMEDEAEVIEEMLGDVKGKEKDKGSEESNEVDETTEKSEAVNDDIGLSSTEVREEGSEPTETKSEVIPSRITPQLPPEPIGRCSNKLQEKIINLFEKKQRGNLDWNDNIQKRKDFRNPSIYEKLLSFCNLNETGSNYPKSLFDPTCWTEESYYENLSKAQKEAYEKKEKEKAKQARTQIEFVTGTKKPEEGKKRKSKWDVAAPAGKTATPPTKVGIPVPGSAPSVGDIAPAAKKPKVSA